MDINVEYLSKLARIELTEAEKKKFEGELQKILDHFKELQEVDTESVEAMSGGTELENITREDKVVREVDTENLTDAFPDKKGELLKVPKIFTE